MTRWLHSNVVANGLWSPGDKARLIADQARKVVQHACVIDASALADSSAGAGGGNVTHGAVTNNFYINGATDPEAIARKVSDVLMSQLGSARQMQVGM